MDILDKTEKFAQELKFIRNPDIRESAETLIGILPDYFFEIPASSTGKYHPAYGLGDGGLLRHTRAAVRIAVELFRIETYDFTDDERDLIIVALIMHDGWKSGWPKQAGTLTEHPLISGKMVMSAEKELSISKSYVHIIKSCIESHMGQWIFDRYGNQVLPKPILEVEHFVHLCDYLASRKCLTMEFDVPLSR